MANGKRKSTQFVCIRAQYSETRSESELKAHQSTPSVVHLHRDIQMRAITVRLDFSLSSSFSSSHIFAPVFYSLSARDETGFDDGREYQTFPQLIIIAKRTSNMFLLMLFLFECGFPLLITLFDAYVSFSPAFNLCTLVALFIFILFSFFSGGRCTLCLFIIILFVHSVITFCLAVVKVVSFYFSLR